MQFGGQMGQLECLFGEFWAASAQAFFLRAKKSCLGSPGPVAVVVWLRPFGYIRVSGRQI